MESGHVYTFPYLDRVPASGCPHDDCQRDKDKCCDCFNGNLYKSPDQPDNHEDDWMYPNDIGAK
jgi:hypothetical protein